MPSDDDHLVPYSVRVGVFENICTDIILVCIFEVLHILNMSNTEFLVVRDSHP